MQSTPAGPIAPLPPENESGRSIPAATSRQVEPDSHLLSSAERLGLGSLGRLVPIFDPALQWSESGQTGAVAGKILTVTSVGGTLDVEQNWNHYRLRVVYRGADAIYRPSDLGISSLPYQVGNISQELLLGRWTLRLRDDASYSSGGGFGGLFLGGPAQAGIGTLNSIQPTLVSAATIQTGLARQVYNTAVGEIDYSRSRRTTLTLVASANLVHFLDRGYINSEDFNGRIGYNYALSAKNNIGLTYGRDRTSFFGSASRMETDLLQLAFGRKITGRLAFQVEAGPQLFHFVNYGLAKTRQLSWSAFSALTYQRGHAGYSLSYFRGVSPGSGVLFGSNSEFITGTANREITRFWSASMNGGYASSKALAPSAMFSSQFNNWFAGANLNRQIGAQVYLGLSYGFQQQSIGGGSCPVLSCGLPGSFSQLGVNLQWHPLARGR